MNKVLIDKELAKKVIKIVDAGLCKGTDDGTFDADGKPIPGHMCVEAAVNFALGDEHGYEPKCVGPDVRDLKISLNDSDGWKSKKSRAEGLRRIAVAQLGSNKINQRRFSRMVCREYFDEFYTKKLVGLSMNKARELLLSGDSLFEAPTHFVTEDAPAAEDIIADLDEDNEENLKRIAEIVERVLVKMKTPGSKFLPLCDLKKRGKKGKK